MLDCIIPSCGHGSGEKNTISSNISLFSFPKDADVIKSWLNNASFDPRLIEELIPQILADKRGDQFRICSAHFVDDCVYMQVVRRKLRIGSVPTIFIPTTAKKQPNIS